MMKINLIKQSLIKIRLNPYQFSLQWPVHSIGSNVHLCECVCVCVFMPLISQRSKISAHNKCNCKSLNLRPHIRCIFIMIETPSVDFSQTGVLIDQATAWFWSGSSLINQAAPDFDLACAWLIRQPPDIRQPDIRQCLILKFALFCS